MDTSLIALLTCGAVLAAAMAVLAGTALARAGFPLPAPHKRIGCVDGLRGFLALSVLAHHFVI